MVQLELNDVEASRLALEKVWEQLALGVDRAKSFGEASKQDPAVLNDPLAVAYLRWVTVFEREIAAVQTIADAAREGDKIETEKIRAARIAGDKLLEILERAQSQVLTPA
jgi:hypothetical protein